MKASETTDGVECLSEERDNFKINKITVIKGYD